MSDAISLFIKAKEESNFRPAYITSLRQYLTQFSRGREHIPVASITSQHIEDWFASRSEAPSSRVSNLGRLSSFFSWCQRRKFIQENPCDFIEPIRVERKAPEILTVDQIQTCLEFCRSDLKRFFLWFTLAGCVGIRREELARLTKNKIKENISRKLIVIDAEVSKVHRRRVIELTDWQLAWINCALEESQAKLPLPKTYVTKSLRALRALLGFAEWPQDVLRHTALSHLLAEKKDAGRVALDAGNSPKILLTHYNGLVMPEDNEKLRKILPQ